MPRALTIRSGSVRVRVFANRDGARVRWEVRWTDHHGLRHRLKRSRKPEAKAEARRIADDLAAGHHRAELTLADLARFRAGVLNLVGTGKTLELATAEYAEMRQILVGTSCTTSVTIPTPAALARFWLEHKPAALGELTTAAAVAAYLDNKLAGGISPRWHATLAAQLERFATDCPGPISALTASRVQVWHLHLAGMGARSKNNHLAAVQGLFTLPALAPHPHRAAILALEECREAVSVNALWTPEEFQTLLHTALRPWTVQNQRTKRPETHTHLHLLPVLVLGGFAKVRASEIRRIRWPQIDLAHARLKLPFGQTKTQRTRIVPLPAAAVAWLRLLPRTTESLWPWAVSKFSKDLCALAARCNLEWRENALRNSAVTYDQILRPDLRRVAAEAGNSPGVLEKEYLNLDAATVENAEAWFAILPPANAAPVVAMPQNATPSG